MSRSSIFAAALLLAGLTAFVLLVSGGGLHASGDGAAPRNSEEPEALAQVTIEAGTWIAYEEATFVEPTAVR